MGFIIFYNVSLILEFDLLGKFNFVNNFLIVSTRGFDISNEVLNFLTISFDLFVEAIWS